MLVYMVILAAVESVVVSDVGVHRAECRRIQRPASQKEVPPIAPVANDDVSVRVAAVAVWVVGCCLMPALVLAAAAAVLVRLARTVSACSREHGGCWSQLVAVAELRH